MKRSNRPKLHNLPSSSQINFRKYKSKGYIHFDRQKRIEHVAAQILDKNYIAERAFLPFIHFDIKMHKYIEVERSNTQTGLIKGIKERKTKIRPIYYASHTDSFIYKYYGEQLNNKYNEYAQDHDIDDIATAYRNNKKGQNNIDFAKEVFKHIMSYENATVISLDFKSFFDKIDHRLLKSNIKQVLGVDEIPKDFYKVLKSITRFNYIEKTHIDSYLKVKYGPRKFKEKRKDGSLTTLMSPKEFRVFKKKFLCRNENDYGIPQGSGISAVCSNVQLIEFDKELKKWACEKKALYRRYCDDLILVIPSDRNDALNASQLEEEVYKIIYKYKGLEIQRDKTEVRLFKTGEVYDVQGDASQIDYLGFTFNGRKLQIREKSLFKYYSRAYRKARISRDKTELNGRVTHRKKLYQLYTHLGKRYKKRGNFITYANKAYAKMKDLPCEVIIKKQIKRHWSKIQKVIKE